VVAAQLSDWDPLDPGSISDPIAYDNEVRRKCPVAFSEQWGGFWGLFDHDSVVAATRDTTNFISAPTQTWPKMDTGSPWLPLQSDAPLHRQYRSPLIPFFRGERIAAFEPRLAELTNEIIDTFIEKGRADIAAELNIPIPAIGMCLLLNLPESNWRNFYDWTTTIVSSAAIGDMEAIGKCFQEVTEFADAWIRDRRNEPKDDVVDAMLSGVVEGRPWTDQEIRGTFTLLFSAGHQTTADALTYAIEHLANHPEHRALLRENPALIPTAVTEFVRLAAPIRALARTTTTDVELGGRTIPANSPVVMMWGAASRDEAYFENPDDFDVNRDNRRALSFGSGIHRCLGEEFAKLEIAVVLREFLARVPDFELDGEGVRATWPTNGYHSLHIQFPAGQKTSTAAS
jgi:cytochrome P450